MTVERPSLLRSLRNLDTILGRRTHPCSSDSKMGRLVPSEASHDLTLMSNSPARSLMATTIVSVDPNGTIPVIGLAQGPLPFWISIQQSTLSPGNQARLNLTPSACPRCALFTSEVEFDDFQVADDHRRFGGRLLVIVVPLAAKSFSLVPHLYQLFIILHYHRVLVELALGVRFGTLTSILHHNNHPKTIQGSTVIPQPL